MALRQGQGGTYKGIERRQSARRTTADRRKEIRWEPSNPNRRKLLGRRASDSLGVTKR